MTQHESTRLEQMEDKIDELAESVAEIKKALLGSDFTDGKGLIHKQSDIETRLARLERLVWIGTGIGLAAGVIYSLISLLK